VMRVILSPAAQRDIGRLGTGVAERVLATLYALRDNPRPTGCKLLRDRTPPTWRVRVGDWRVPYEVDDEAGILTVTGVRHRSKAY
jgi:mRNA interferase RelE/StbE